MKENKTFIESLSKLVETKKIQLGVNSSIAEIKSLAKYIDFNNVSMPKSFDLNKALGSIVTTKADGYVEKFYSSYRSLNRESYIFDKIASEVAKKVASDVITILEDGAIEDVNRYIEEKSGFKNIKVSFAEECIGEGELGLLKDVLDRLKKSDLQMVRIENTHPEAQCKDFYGVLNSRLKINMIGLWRRRVPAVKVDVKDIILLVAIGRIITDCFSYIKKHPERLEEWLKGEMYPNTIFEDSLSVDEIISRLNRDEVIEKIEKEKHLRFPMQLISLLNCCMRDIVIESGVILDYEKSIREVSGDYAKPYMTKKHITKKMENYMSNNKFLEMFGYVEADNSCDIEKLQQLEEEFQELSTKISLPIAKDHSLRFRKLGNFKASGLYVYQFRALCVDIDGVSSFVHEMFHMLDFTNGLLSLDAKFKIVVNKYSEIVNEKIDSLDKENEFYKQWNSKNKYNKAYFLNPREIFARAGELYVSQVLGIKSSLVERDFLDGNKKYIYPLNKDLLELIDIYFDEFFEDIRSESRILSFDNSESNINDNLYVSANVVGVLDVESTNKLKESNSKNVDFLNDKGCIVEQLSLF